MKYPRFIIEYHTYKTFEDQWWIRLEEEGGVSYYIGGIFHGEEEARQFIEAIKIAGIETEHVT